MNQSIVSNNIYNQSLSKNDYFNSTYNNVIHPIKIKDGWVRT